MEVTCYSETLIDFQRPTELINGHSVWLRERTDEINKIKKEKKETKQKIQKAIKKNGGGGWTRKKRNEIKAKK
jgi:hypothetical protein